MVNIPKPVDRQDQYYNYIINGGDINKLPEPLDRIDHYLYYLCVNGFDGGGGESGGVTPKMLDAAVAAALATSESYTNTKVADLVGTAPETLDTIEEVANAIRENETVVEALNAAIGNKLDKDGGIIGSDDASITIDGTGITGDSNSTISNFAEVNANFINGEELHYNNQDTDQRYVKQEDAVTSVNGQTGAVNITVTDTKVTQTNTTTSANYRLLLSENANDTTQTEGARKSSKFYANPSTGVLTAPIFKGQLDGAALSATYDGEGNNIEDTYLPKSGGNVTGDIQGVAQNGKQPALKGFKNLCVYPEGSTICEIIDNDNYMSAQLASDGGGIYVLDEDNRKVYIHTDGLECMDLDNDLVNFYIKNRCGDYNNHTTLTIPAVASSQTSSSIYASAMANRNIIGVSLGNASNKWKEVYAVNGTIQTSDRNEKNTIKEISTEEALTFLMCLKPSSYKMNSGTSNRRHLGLISQDVEEGLNKIGWNSLDFAGFIKSQKVRIITEDENGNPLKEPIEEIVEGEYDYSLRYDEFIAPMIKVIQDLNDRVASLEAELADLKQS